MSESREWVFTVSGNEKNPVPYKRITQATKNIHLWSKRPDRFKYLPYIEWKKHVRACFIDEFQELPQSIFEKWRKYYLDIVIYFKDKKGGDPDNIGKGILDSIFASPLNDKYVVSRVRDFYFDSEQPRVEVHIREGEKIL